MRCGDRRKGYVGSFSEFDIDLETFMREVVLPDCPPPIFALGHSMGATVLIRAAHRGHRWFDRMVLTAPMIAHRASVNSMAVAGAAVDACAAVGRLRRRMYVPGRYRGVLDLRPFRRQYPDLAIRCAMPAMPRFSRRSRALGFGGPTVAWCDAAFRAMRAMHDPGYPARIRQPMLIVAAGSDAIVSNTAIEEFAMLLRAGSHLVVVGAQHEILMEQDRYRSQFWAAFDAFVPGTPLY